MFSVYSFLRTPRWAAASAVVVLIIGLFVNLGLWQLRRAEDRRLENLVGRERIAAPTSDFLELLAAVGDDADSLEWRSARVSGEYLPQNEVLVRSTVNRGQAGFDVVTPFRVAGTDRVVLINRGWVPAEFDDAPVAAKPPAGVVDEVGWIRLGEVRPLGGSTDPLPPNEIVSRVDPPWFESAFGYEVFPVWIQRSGEGRRLPIPSDVQPFDDAGPHLSYSIQWFSFAAISIVGYVMLIRSNRRKDAEEDLASRVEESAD